MIETLSRWVYLSVEKCHSQDWINKKCALKTLKIALEVIGVSILIGAVTVGVIGLVHQTGYLSLKHAFWMANTAAFIGQGGCIALTAGAGGILVATAILSIMLAILIR